MKERKGKKKKGGGEISFRWEKSIKGYASLRHKKDGIIINTSLLDAILITHTTEHKKMAEKIQ